jgi:hypothetical protein
MGATLASGAWQPRQISRGVSLLKAACSGRLVIGLPFRPITDRKMKNPITPTAIAMNIRSFFLIESRERDRSAEMSY